MDGTEGERLTKRQRRELKKQQRREEQEKRLRSKKMSRWLVIVIILAAIGGGTYWTVNLSNTNNSSDNIDSGAIDNPRIGPEDAKVVITEFSDFSCPACAEAAPTVKQLTEEYGDQIALVFNGFNLRHDWSEKSLEAGECAHKQGKFWALHDLLFTSQKEWSSNDEAINLFKQYAEEAGLNTEEFISCLDNDEMSDEVKRDTNVAADNKVDATPTFRINDQILVGAKSTEEFKEIIDQELNK
ncbi:thioredoxin domain-containing protein [Patescibacteria group bacterium]|nr:thioredoxin domain-containing protein [Patescibacteria group bacterium]MBU0963696.1 thioredoxin domain-containing protein [Patescibacteria group bacterium]